MKRKKRFFQNYPNGLVVENTIPNSTIRSRFNIKREIARFVNGYIRYSLTKIGYIPSHNIRNFFYRKVFLVEMSDFVVVYYGAEIRDPYNLKIGRGTIIGDKVILDARRGIEIGDNVNLSTGVQMWTLQHDYNDPFFGVKGGGIKIADRVWVGPSVTILPNVTIGEGAVVAGGALVTKNVEAYSIVAGIPAKKIGERSKDLLYEFNGNRSHFY